MRTDNYLLALPIVVTSKLAASPSHLTYGIFSAFSPLSNEKNTNKKKNSLLQSYDLSIDREK